MGPFGVVFDPPVINDPSRFLQVREPVVVQTFPPKQRIKAFNERV
jgi:hypothetical protein